MPNTVVSDLKSAVQDVLVAATIGRGAWAILVPSSSMSGKIALPLEPAVVHPGDPVEGVTIMLDAGGWQLLDNNRKTRMIAAGGNQLFQLHQDGRIWRSTGTPCNGDACAGWELLDNNSKTQEIVASGDHLYQRHNDGWIWRFTGPAWSSATNCPGWRRLDNNAKTARIVVGGLN